MTQPVRLVFDNGGGNLSGATFSPCMTWRYRLWRNLVPLPINGYDGGTCLFVMLNPSTADQTINDPTVERCQRRATAWGYSRLEVCNIFAFRSTDPRALYDEADPIGPGNNAAIREAAAGARLVVCAWGTHGQFMGRGRQVERALRGAGARPHYLKLNADGQPAHPLYLPYSMEPKLW